MRIPRSCCWFIVIALLLVTERRAAAQAAPASAPDGQAAGQGTRIPLPDLQHITADTRAQVEHDAVQYLRAVQAIAIDPDLPDMRLDRWLDSVLRLPAQWAMTDCGAERKDGHGPICIRITQSSRGLDLSIAIGTDERGVTGRPRLVAAGLRLFDIDGSVERLSLLPDMLVEAEARRQRFADHPMQSFTAADLARLRGSLRARGLQPDLPDEPFEAWLRGVLASEAPAEWRLVSCNPIPNAAAPQCVNVDVRWPDGARARVTLDLEMVQRGLAADPAFRMAFIYRGPPARGVEPFRSLREFGEVLRTVAAAHR